MPHLPSLSIRRSQAQILVLGIVLSLIAGFYLATFRTGHRWGGDFSMYILHARNIVEGRAYQDTGYIYNSARPVVGPRQYPPIFPFMLAPLYARFGVALAPMKIGLLFCFLTALLLITRTISDAVPFSWAVVFLGVLGFNPFFWNFKDNVLSDIPFLMFAYAALLVFSYGTRPHLRPRSRILYALAGGLLLYCATGTRSVGIVLLPTLLVYEILKNRRISFFSIITAGGLAALTGGQSMLLGTAGSYADQLIFQPVQILERLFWIYPVALGMVWDNGYRRLLHWIMYALLCGLAVRGFWYRLRQGVSVYEVFVPMYLVPIILWPAPQGTRFMIPMIPLFLLYVMLGLGPERKDWSLRPTWKLLLLAGALTVSYIGVYTTLDYPELPDGVHTEAAVAMFDYVSQQTEEDAVCIFLYPRILSLFAGRRASVYHEVDDEQDLMRYFRDIGADYLIVGAEDPAWLGVLVERHSENFRIVYSELGFQVYRIMVPS